MHERQPRFETLSFVRQFNVERVSGGISNLEEMGIAVIMVCWQTRRIADMVEYAKGRTGVT